MLMSLTQGLWGVWSRERKQQKRMGWVVRWKMLACENKLSVTAADMCNLFCDVMDVVFHKCLSQQYSLCPKIIFSFACQ